MTKTYKYKSKIATAISFLAALIAYLGRDGLTEILPAEYAYLIPIIIFCAGYILTQTTENKRVEIAEKMLLEQFSNLIPVDDVDPASEYENLNEEYTTGDCEDESC